MTHNGWHITPPRWPAPWTATGPNYDAWTEYGEWRDNGERVSASTREVLVMEIERFEGERE